VVEIDMSDDAELRVWRPAGPLGPHLSSPNRVLGEGPDGVLVPPRSILRALLNPYLFTLKY
jgi:hypothetical protein